MKAKAEVCRRRRKKKEQTAALFTVQTIRHIHSVSDSVYPKISKSIHVYLSSANVSDLGLNQHVVFSDPTSLVISLLPRDVRIRIVTEHHVNSDVII